VTAAIYNAQGLTRGLIRYFAANTEHTGTKPVCYGLGMLRFHCRRYVQVQQDTATLGKKLNVGVTQVLLEYSAGPNTWDTIV
jgi:hypothetical protein